MRLTSTPSHYSYYVAVVALLTWLLPGTTVATVTLTPTDGCFLHDSATVHVNKPECSARLSNDAASETTTTVTFENVDPNAVDFSGVAATFTNREKSSFTAELTVPVGTTEFVLAPWFDLGDDYYFVALSDNQARGTVETNPEFDDVLAQVAAVNPPFFTNSGDLIAGSDETETLQDMFGAVQTTLSDVAAPMYPVPGNHDYGDGLDTYTSLFGEVDYAYDVGSVHFIALSTSGTESRGEVSAEQLAWLESELQTSQARTVIYFHHPLSVPSWGQSTCCFLDTTNRDAVADLIDRYAVDLMIVGHSQGYDYRYLTASDVSTIDLGLYQLVTGGGGGNIAQPGGDYHYTLVHVTPEGVTHEPIYEDDFGLAVDYENNRGTKTRATAVVENDSDYDLPFVRLRFRLDTTASDFTISDDLGNYYTDYDQHAYADYTAVYVAVSASANTTTTFTVTPATQLHSGITQTVTTTGLVDYETAPSNADTSTALTAQPETADIVITNLTSSSTGLTWQHTATAGPETTTYTLSSVADYQVIDIFLDNVLAQRVVANATGEVEFTVVTSDIAQHDVRLAIVPARAKQVMIVPNALGDPQVRIFNDAGLVRGQWYAFTDELDTVQPPYVIWQGNFTGDSTNEVVVSAKAEAGAKYAVGLYTDDGTALTTLELPIQPVMADLTGSGYNSLIYYSARQRYMRSRSYGYDSQELELQRWHLPKTYRSARLRLLTAADTDYMDGAELAFVDTAHDRIVLMQTNGSTLQVTGKYSLPRGSTVTAVTTGQIDARSTRAWLVAYTNRHGTSHVLALQPKTTGTNLRVTHRLRLAQTTVQQLIAEPTQAGKRDRIIVATSNQQLAVYRPTNQAGFKREQKISTGLSGSTAVQLGSVVGNQTYPRQLVIAETIAPGRVEIWTLASSTERWGVTASWFGYGEDFPGGVTIAEQ